jgi:hypothetical protein
MQKLIKKQKIKLNKSPILYHSNSNLKTYKKKFRDNKIKNPVANNMKSVKYNKNLIKSRLT